jgi:hypothetical protein
MKVSKHNFFAIERISQKSNTQLIKYEEMGESENRDV